MNSALLAYQPIYDRNRSVVGGKLLCRSDNGLAMLSIDNTADSNELISLYSAITDLSARLQCPLYLQLSRTFLCADAFFPLNPADVVIELQATDATPDEELINAIYRWRQRGFRFALSHMQLSSKWRAVAEVTEVIAVEINQPVEQIAEFREQLAVPHSSWLAGKVESTDSFLTCSNVGFSLFQGYFLASPAIPDVSGVPVDTVEIIDTVEKLYIETADVTALCEFIERDSAVALPLFRIANSSLYPGHRSILSAEQAVIRIGVEQTRKWLVLLTCLKQTSAGAVHLVLTRACACAEAARVMGNQRISPDDAFLAGLLSGLDLLVNVDKRQLLDDMGINVFIRDAALSNRGLLGGVLSSVIAVEQAINGKPAARISDKILHIYQQQSVQIHCVLLCI